MRLEKPLLAGCIALFLLLSGVRAWDHAIPGYDDAEFLELGNQAKEIGGPAGLLRALYAGTWTEDNRNPLYAGVLSLVAGRDTGYHARARILTIFIGVLALLAWWRAARKHAGPRGALVLAAFMAVSECFVDYAGRASAEPLLLLCWALAIDAILDGIARPRRWIAAGFWAGLAQLDKGSGIFLLFCFAAALLLWRGVRGLRSRWAWGMGLAFLAAASPLLVRNARVYGSPLHHWNNRLFWIDRLPDYAEIYAPAALERLPHGFAEWAAQTNWREIFYGRGVLGTAEIAVHLGDAMSFVAPTPLGAVHIPGVILGFGLLIAGLRILYRQPGSFARTFLLVQGACFIGFFFCFTVAGGSSRYVFPMALSIYAVLAAALAAHPEWLARWAAMAGACVALALALDPSTRRAPPGFAGAEAWLLENLEPGDAYAIDSRSLLRPSWFLPAWAKQVVVSSSWKRKALQPAELLPYFRSRGVRYVVIDAGSRSVDGQPRRFFFDREPSDFPADLQPIWSDSGFSILRATPPPAMPEAARAP